MKRWHLILILVTILAAVGGAAFLLSNRHAPESPVVRVGYLGITASLPLYIAEEKGYFTAEGVRIASQQVATSNQLVDAIVAGNLDVVVETSAVPVLAVELQSPGKIKVFATSDITQEAPFDSVLVKQDSPVTSLRDLANKRIGVFPGSTASTLLKKHLQDEGIDISNAVFVPTPPQSQLAALKEGSIDALHAYEPTTAIALVAGGYRQIHGSVYADMLNHNPQGVAIVSSAFLSQHPKEAKATIRALEQGMMLMRQDAAEARRILATRMKLDAAVANRSVFLYMEPHTSLDVAVFQQYGTMLKDVGELPAAVDTHAILYRD